MKETLDFIIIGAQKAGTTSLASYLTCSPQVFIPPEKEIPYFLDGKMQQLGWRWYVETYFRNAGPASLWGTSTPQYMMHPESFAAIKEKLPNVKIIVTLRDPIARLLSHFDMATRLGVEVRPLNQMVEEQLGKLAYYRETSYPDHTGKYVVTGEYGRILGELLQHFDASQVLVIDFEDICRHAQQTVNRLSEFLGIAQFTPENLNTVRMKGGGRKRIPVDHDRIIAMLARPIRLFDMAELVPKRLKLAIGRLSSRLDEWNVDATSKSNVQDLKPELLSRLKAHYLKDAYTLEGYGIHASWVRSMTPDGEE